MRNEFNGIIVRVDTLLHLLQTLPSRVIDARSMYPLRSDIIKTKRASSLKRDSLEKSLGNGEKERETERQRDSSNKEAS